ncbi:hypothetical protein N836_13330 [Leptolyngbya sp. Heron Island J]|nr:hypothetical protein N836_13330 [Leptolyngbya sp. Heron Island J]
MQQAQWPSEIGQSPVGEMGGKPCAIAGIGSQGIANNMGQQAQVGPAGPVGVLTQ